MNIRTFANDGKKFPDLVVDGNYKNRAIRVCNTIEYIPFLIFQFYNSSLITLIEYSFNNNLY